jgi:hypothetical protein
MLPDLVKETPEGPPIKLAEGVRELTPDAASVGGNDQVTNPLPPELSPKKDCEGDAEGTHVVTTTVGVMPHVKHSETCNVLVHKAEVTWDGSALAEEVTGHINGVPQLTKVVVVRTVTVTRGLKEHVGSDIMDPEGAIQCQLQAFNSIWNQTDRYSLYSPGSYYWRLEQKRMSPLKKI